METESISEAPINRYIAMKGHFSFQQKGIFQKDYWAYKSNPVFNKFEKILKSLPTWKVLTRILGHYAGKILALG